MEKLVELNRRNFLAAICTGLICAITYTAIPDTNTVLFMGILMYFWLAYLFQERQRETISIEELTNSWENIPKYTGKTMKQDFLNWDSSNEVPDPFIRIEDE